MDAEQARETSERDQLWASLRALRAEIDRLAAGEPPDSERYRQIVMVLAKITAADLDFRARYAAGPCLARGGRLRRTGQGQRGRGQGPGLSGDVAPGGEPDLTRSPGWELRSDVERVPVLHHVLAEQVRLDIDRVADALEPEGRGLQGM